MFWTPELIQVLKDVQPARGALQHAGEALDRTNNSCGFRVLGYAQVWENTAAHSKTQT